MSSEEKIKDISKQLDEFTFLDKTQLETLLICNICNRHLNVSPIVYNENIGNVCGRCSSGSTLSGLGTVFRLQIYEDLITNLTFPCTNKNYGCTEVLKYEEVLQHEKQCRYQCTSCPLLYKQLFPDKTCSWTGNTQALNDHLLVTHRDYFLDPPQVEWPASGKNLIYFTHFGTQVITIVIRHEKNTKFACLVMMNGTDLESQCLRYQLELSDEDKNNSLLFRRNRLQPLENFFDTLQFPEKILEVDTDKISEMLQNPKKIYAKFSIAKKNKKELSQIPGFKMDLLSGVPKNSSTTKEKSGIIDEELLAELECPVCNEFMIPPIYICGTGHSVCSECKGKILECPTCRRPHAEGRNYTLEKLTLKVKYPCRNRDIGCGFVTTSDKIKQHQNYCELTENPCIFKCGWKGVSPGIYNHFLDKHRSCLLEQNAAYRTEVKNTSIKHHFLYVMGELFYLGFKNCGKPTEVKFVIQHLGYISDEPKFKYILHVSPDEHNACPSLSISNFCQRWNNKFTESALVSIISGDLLKSLGFNNSYYFKINITKV